MKTRFLVLICFYLFSPSILISQNIINGQSYTFDNGFEGWSTEALSNTAAWTWNANGKASGGTYWNGRDSIHSNSLGGAVVLDGDSIISNEVGDTSMIYAIALVSPDLDFDGISTVYLSFHQYYRNFESGTRIEYLDGGGNWAPIPNPLNLNVAKNVETGAADYQVINLSALVGGLQTSRIRFVFTGKQYFWILDDIAFYDDFPYPQTTPEYVGDSLSAFAYTFQIDEAGWPYVEDQLVIQFKTGTPEPVKQDLRDSLGAILIDTCACDRLELWLMGDDVFAGGDTLSGFGGSIGIQERIKGSKASSSIDGVDFNKYNYNQLQDGGPPPNLPFGVNPFGIDTPSDSAILVAVLDTGIDLDHEILQPFIYKNNDEEQEGNEVDDDGNCLVDDWFGWNYVDKNNNPNDDHSHGTHVAGIIQQNMQNFDAACNYRIIPYKTHDYHGFATLFNVSCATYQAQIDGASVLNDSWGFYGNSSIILANAVDTARINDVLIVSAAGNDTTDLSTLPQYPACYPNSNIITVGSYSVFDQIDTLLTGFSNFDPLCVDILAPGDNILSTVPGDLMDFKSGTSMAAPAIAAAAVWAYCAGHGDFLEVKNNILDCSNKISDLSGVVRDGNVFDPDQPCITPTEELVLENKTSFTVYPNPVSSALMIENVDQAMTVNIDVYSLNGKHILGNDAIPFYSFETKQLDFTSLPAGIYILKIQNRDFIQTHKIVRQ